MRSQLFSLALALSVIGCGHSDKRDETRASQERGGSRGPDPVLLRIPRTGGTVRAYLYPKLDSIVWTGNGSSIDRVLGFDPEWGSLAIIDQRGRPARIDLRMGESNPASASVTLASLTSANGSEIYGIDPKASIIRLTRGGDWNFAPPSGARAVFPQTDGSVIIAAQRGAEAVLWSVRPPDTKILDSAVLFLQIKGARAQAGDRIYFGTDTGLVGVKVRDLSMVPSIRFKEKIVAIAPTPSGDRIYTTTVSERGVSVIDRYTDKVVTDIELPGLVSELRMDPLGRYLIARPLRGDSAWVIAIATDHLVGTIQTVWTSDLPACAPDGAIAANTGRDVVFMDGETLQPVRTVADGAKDFWYFMFWNGFRPRAAGLDQPVSFGHKASDSISSDSATGDSTRAAHDSAAIFAKPPARTSITPAPSGAHPAPGASPPSGNPPPGALPQVKPSKPQTFSVSFAALLSEPKARELAGSINVNGAKPHVVSAQRAGTTVWRVVLGPFPTHDAAQKAGEASQKTFWVYADEQ